MFQMRATDLPAVVTVTEIVMSYVVKPTKSGPRGWLVTGQVRQVECLRLCNVRRQQYCNIRVLISQL